jgi:hypothetical protein
VRKTLLRTLALSLLAVLALGIGAKAAVIEVEGLILRTDGGFEPHLLPRRAFAPVIFQGQASIASRGGGMPPALQRIVLDFDRNGHLSTAGLPTCAPAQVENASVQEARRACPGAIVGKGEVAAVIALPGTREFEATSPLTVFNGPTQNGLPTVVLHAQVTSPVMQTFAVLAPIERLHGRYGYRVTIELPPIAGGHGALTRIETKLGRRYSFGGRRRSYVAARCPSGILRVHGDFLFSDGTVIDGAVEKPCSARP